jgi:hypothetical protein
LHTVLNSNADPAVACPSENNLTILAPHHLHE